MKSQIDKTVEERIRPKLLKHHGDMEIVSVKDGICRVRLSGKCSNCPAASITMEEIIRKELMEEHPQLKDVVLVDEISQDMWDFAKKLLHKDPADSVC